jgi:hypothetical protein
MSPAAEASAVRAVFPTAGWVLAEDHEVEPGGTGVETAGPSATGPARGQRDVEDIVTDDSASTRPPSHDDVPLPDYDHLPLGTLQHRIRTLTLDELTTVMAYEEAHGHRLPVLETMRARLKELQDGAEPSGGSPQAATPEHAPPPAGGSSVTPETSGPPMNPPSHGAPENPAQPRPTG